MSWFLVEANYEFVFIHSISAAQFAMIEQSSIV